MTMTMKTTVPNDVNKNVQLTDINTLSSEVGSLPLDTKDGLNLNQSPVVNRDPNINGSTSVLVQQSHEDIFSKKKKGNRVFPK